MSITVACATLKVVPLIEKLCNAGGGASAKGACGGGASAEGACGGGASAEGACGGGATHWFEISLCKFSM